MGRWAQIDRRVWNDKDFLSWGDDGQLAWLFLLSHPNMTQLGAMRASLAGLAAEKGWSEERLRNALSKALAKGSVRVDERACLVWLPKFLWYNPPANPNVVKSWGKAFDMIPECALQVEIAQGLKAFVEGLDKGFKEALPEAIRNGMAKQYQYQEQYQEQLTTPTAKQNSVVKSKTLGIVASKTTGAAATDSANSTQRGDDLAPRQAHNLAEVGSIPTPATKAARTDTDGHGQARTKHAGPDEGWRRWTAAAEAMRRAGWAERDVRRLLGWARRWWLDPTDEQFMRLVGACLDAQDRARNGAARWMGDLAGYVIGWAQPDDSGSCGLILHPPADNWLRAGRKSFEERLEEQNGAEDPRWTALIADLGFKRRGCEHGMESGSGGAGAAGVGG